MNDVRTRDEAIALADQALHTWSATISLALTSAQTTAGQACAHAEQAVQERTNIVASIEAMLASADPERRRELEARLVQAKARRDQAKRALVRTKDVAAGVARLHRTHATATAQVETARAQLSAMSRALESYRTGGTPIGDTGSTRSGTPTSAGSSSNGTGLADIDANSADLNDNPILDDGGATGKFGKGGLTRADYRWAVQTWADIVGPGVANGKTRDDFAARDEQTNAQPLRRTSDVYDLFLGSDRIRVERRPDGSLNIINGRHRLVIARELGIKTLPGELR